MAALESDMFDGYILIDVVIFDLFKCPLHLTLRFIYEFLDSSQTYVTRNPVVYHVLFLYK